MALPDANGTTHTTTTTTTTGITDLDASTMAEVLSRLPPDGIVSAASTCTHLRSSADEPMWRRLFDEAWDEPVWAVDSYRDLYLARHRALTFVAAAAAGSGLSRDATTPNDDDKLPKGRDEEKKNRVVDDDDDDVDRIAVCCEEVARAVNASRHVVKTDKTLEAADCLRGLRRMLLILKKRVEADKRDEGEGGRGGGRSSSGRSSSTSKHQLEAISSREKGDAANGRALLAVCSALSALIIRCESARAALLATHENIIGKELLRACFLSDKAEESSSFASFLGWLGPAAGGTERTPPASLDALAASLGGAPTPPATWPLTDETTRARADLALALVFAPLCLLGEEGRETNHGRPLPSHPFLASTAPSIAAAAAAAATADDDASGSFGGGRELVPVVASVPGRGPWPRGGRPPHGQRVRMERVGGPPTVASVSGAWCGCRLSRRASGGAGDVGRGGGGVDAAEAAAVDALFRLTLTVSPEGKVSGWMADTVGNLTLRGVVDPAGGGAVVIEAAFTDCGGLPGALFSTLQHGRAKMRMRGWATATAIAGEWRQWSVGNVSEGVFLLWPNDDGKEGSRGMKKSP